MFIVLREKFVLLLQTASVSVKTEVGASLQSITEPTADIGSLKAVLGEIQTSFRKLQPLYKPWISKIPLQQGMTWDPTWKALPEGFLVTTISMSRRIESLRVLRISRMKSRRGTFLRFIPFQKECFLRVFYSKRSIPFGLEEYSDGNGES